MLRGLYTACSAMMAGLVRQDVLANNVANSNTSGYKKDVAVLSSFPSMVLYRLGEAKKNGSEFDPVKVGLLGTGVCIDEIACDPSSGFFQPTGNPLDLAITSQGYFVVESPQGERYTRNGAFHLDAEGKMVNEDGYALLGEKGYIYLENPANVRVSEKGEVFSNDELVDTIKVVTFSDPKSLQKIGANLFRAEQEGQGLDNPGVRQGYLEMSNVNVVREMVDLISVVRSYEIAHKVIQAEDETLDKVVNQVGRV